MTIQVFTEGSGLRSEKVSRLKETREILVSDRESVGNKWTKAEMSKKILEYDEKIEDAIENISIGSGGIEMVAVKIRCLFLMANVFLAHFLMHRNIDFSN